MTTYTPVDYDPFAPKPGFPKTDTFRSNLAPGWKDTGDFRTPAKEDALRASGAATVAPGKRSMHSLGTADAPGAHDVVAPGYNAPQVMAYLRQKGLPVSSVLWESPQGGQGGHFHVEMGHNPKLTPVDEDPFKPTGPGPHLTPIDHDPFASGTIHPKLTPVDYNPFAAPQGGTPGVSVRAAQPENELLGGRPGRERRHAALNEIFTQDPRYTFDPTVSAIHRGFAMVDYLLSPISGKAEEAEESLQRKAGGHPILDEQPDIERRHLFGDIVAGMVPLPGPAAAREGEALAEGGARAAEKAFTTSGLNRGVRKIFAPATTSTEAMKTAGTIRRARGEHQLDTDRSIELLSKAQKRWGLEQRSPEETAAMIHTIETASQKGPKAPFSRGVKGNQESFINMDRFKNLSHVQDAVDAISETMKYWRSRAETIIAKNVGAAPEFITDYYAHMWKQSPDEVRSALDRFYRQGSGQNFRKRSIPTIQDGIAAGLTPASNNPFEVSARYVQNMARFLTTHDIQGWLKNAGYADWHYPGQQPEGWVKLDGILTERKPVRTGGGRPGKPSDTSGGRPPETPSGPALAGPQQRALPKPGEALPGRARPEAPGAPGEIQGPKVPARVQPDQGRIGSEERLRLTEGDKLNVTPKPGAQTKPKGNVQPVHKEVLYANPDAARVYNNFISKGLETNDAVGDIFKGARRLMGGVTQAVLSLSGFHLFNIAHQAMISEVARGLEGASRRQWYDAAKAFLKSPLAPVTYAMKGDKLQKTLLHALPTDPISEKVGRAFYRSGQQLRMDDFYRTRGVGSFYQSLKRGSFKSDLKDALKAIYQGEHEPGKPIKGALSHVGKTVDLVSNIYQTAMAPLFEVYIPKVKAGAFAENMRSWIAANPGASQDEIDRQAIKIGDTVDNRFGELVQDNLFWNRQMKQLAQIALLAPTWKLGTYREIGGGLADVGKSARGLATGEGISPRTAYIAAMAGTSAVGGAVYQYLKTGKPPQDARDLAVPRTGGVTPQGAPERAEFPGYEKQMFGLTQKPGGLPQGAAEEVGNAVNPGVGLAASLATNKDWRGDPIYRPAGVPRVAGEPSRIEEIAGAIADRLVPISMHPRYKGTNISRAEQFMGVSPAPGYMTDSKHARDIAARYGDKSIVSRMRSDARRKAEEEP